MNKTVGFVVAMICATILGVVAIQDYSQPKPDDIAHDPAASLRQAEAQSPVANDPDALVKSPEYIAEHPVSGMPLQRQEAISQCKAFEITTEKAIEFRKAGGNRESLRRALETGVDLKYKILLDAMLGDVYGNPNEELSELVVKDSFKDCIAYYGY